MAIRENNDVNIYEHLKRNIDDTFINYNRDFKECNFYCFNCMKAVLNDKDHKTHYFIKKNDYYSLNKSIFTMVDIVLQENKDTLEKKKEFSKIVIDNVVNELIKEINIIKKKKKEQINSDYLQLQSNLQNINLFYQGMKKQISTYFKQSSSFYEIPGVNKDPENTIFLINYELITLIKKQNEKLLEEIKKINQSINNFPLQSEDDLKSAVNQINTLFTFKCNIEPFDDFYWDVKTRLNTYDEHMKNFRNTVAKVEGKFGSQCKINELVNEFDYKIKKGVDFIFGQDYFNEDNTNVISVITKKKSIKKRGNPLHKIKSSTLLPSNSISNLANPIKNKSNSDIYNSFDNDSIDLNSPRKNVKSLSACLSANSLLRSSRKELEDTSYITLNNRILGRFFCYSILDLYNKTFAEKPDRNIYETKNILGNYSARYDNLKEYAKPICNTNKISIFNQMTKKLDYYVVPLNRKDHGYQVFPEGCRHIFINDVLYISGGLDILGNEINTFISYDVKSKIIKKLPSMPNAHAYHSIEYLDNYECCVVISGNNQNYYCEIYDFFTSKWRKLPPLNYPRQNANVVYNSVTSEIYVLFGIQDNNRNSDIIEVLELNDIKGGWIKVDYYKNAQFDLTVNYCKVVQFSKDKLLIYGGNDSRKTKKLFAIFMLDKNEIVRITREEELDEIKIKEMNGKKADLLKGMVREKKSTLIPKKNQILNIQKMMKSKGIEYSFHKKGHRPIISRESLEKKV